MGRRRRRRKNKRKPNANNEMQNRRDFYQERPHYIKPDDSESAGEVSEIRRILFANSENITFSLIYLEGPSPLFMDHTRYREVTSIQRELRYFRCPTAVTIAHLKKLLKAKYELRGNNYRVDMFLNEDTLNDEYSLLDISYIYMWNTKDNLSLTFKVFEGSVKRRKRRYFGGVDELPAHYTPLSILQSRLGILANSMAEDNMTEGRRHLRSDIEKKRKEIEAKIEEERRLSERELRSHDEKRREKEKEKEKDNKKNEVKKKEKDKQDEKKKDKNIEGKEKKKEGKNNDDKKKDGKNGEDKKKNLEEKKKKKEGRCQDEKRKEKDDKEDKDEKRKDKEAKEEKNKEKEMRKEGENKRKREAEPEGKRKREKREEIKENNVDKRERKEVKEDGREKTVTGEATSTTSSEPDSTQTSTLTQPPVTTSSSAPTSDQTQTSSSTEEGSATTSATETASDSTSTSEPTSTTGTENEQKTEKADMKEDETPTSSHENRATPPKDSGDTEIQLQISESGVMSMSPVLESGGDVVRTVEERGGGRVTRRSSITGANFRDEGLGNRETRKRGANGKSDEGSPNDSNQKGGVRSPKMSKTMGRSANVSHPSISKEKVKPTAPKKKEQPEVPVQLCKLRSTSRLSRNPSSDAKPIHEDSAVKENKEEEELPQHEIEKEEAQVEPEAAHVAIRDEGEEKRMEEEKRRFEDEKRQNEEEKRKLEEDNKMETTPTNTQQPALKGDPKTFGPLDKDDKCSMIVGASAPDLPTNLKADPKTFGPLDKEDRCSTIVGASAPNLPTNLKGDPKTFEALDNDNKGSTVVGASPPDLPTNLIGDPKTFGPLEKEDKLGANAPNMKGDAKMLGPIDKEDKCSTIVGASAPNLQTNLKGDLNNFGSLDKEDRCATIVSASAPNLLTNPFIPNSNHFLFSDVTLPTDSGNFSKNVESKLDKSLLGKAVAGIGGLGGAGLGVSSGIVSGGFQNPVPNGSTFSPMCYLDPSRFVYPYQTYPVPNTNSFLRGSPLPAFGNMGGFSTVTGFHASLPPCINNLSSPHQSVQVVGLVSQKKNKDDSTKERIKSCDDALNPEKERKKRRRAAETEVTNFLKKEAPGKGTKMEVDEEKDEDDERIFVPAKRKRDEKGSRDKEKKEKGKDDKGEKEKDGKGGDKKMDDEEPA